MEITSGIIIVDYDKNEILAISEDVGRGHYDYLKPIYNNIILKEQDFTLKEAIVKYITDVLYHWKHPKHGFDLKNYLIQYQFQVKAGLATLTIGCDTNQNCNTMQTMARKMIKSINY